MRILTALLCFFVSVPVQSHAFGFEILMPHRAVYDVKLMNAEDRSGIAGMNGRIVYEMRGGACEGVTVNFRFVTRISTGRDEFVTDQQTSSYESSDGNQFSFSTKSFVNERQDQFVLGTAKRDSEGLLIDHRGNSKRSFKLGDGLFTSSHLIDVIRQARDGAVFVTHDVFDGSGSADKLLKSASVIGKPKQVEQLLDDEMEAGVRDLINEEAWPVTMSYFEAEADNSAESTPIYETSFLLYGNGVVRDLLMRYPDYVLKASLTDIEYFERDVCSVEN